MLDFKQQAIVFLNEETKNKEILTEGLKFFKVSKRLYKLSDKLIKKSKMKNKPEIVNTAKKITKLANKFEEAEDLNQIGRKKEAKEKYKKLIKDYSDLLKVLKKSETADALKAVGGLTVTVASMVLPYILLNRIFPSLSFGAVNTAAAKEASVMKQSEMYLKRAAAFTACGIPTRIANNVIRNGAISYDDKIMDQIDKMLS